MTNGRNVQIDRDAQGNVILTGDSNRIYILRGVTTISEELETQFVEGTLDSSECSAAAPQPDVFLSHSHADSEWVEQLAGRLEDEHGLKVWLDRWRLVPGQTWQDSLGIALNTAKSCAICIGSSSPSGWFKEELQVALNLQISDPKFRVIPVVLPNGSDELLSAFLKLRTWADFRPGREEAYAFHVLVKGIKGEPIGRWPPNETEFQIEEMKEFEQLISDLKKFSSMGVSPEIIMDYEKKVLDRWLVWRTTR